MVSDDQAPLMLMVMDILGAGLSFNVSGKLSGVLSIMKLWIVMIITESTLSGTIKLSF